MNDRRIFGFREFVLLLLLIIVGLLAYISYKMSSHSTLGIMVKEHFKAVIAMPSAAVAALLLVFTAHKLNESSKVQFWGIKFDGASSMVISWVLIFITLAVAIDHLW